MHTVLNSKAQVAVGLVQAKVQAGGNVPSSNSLLYIYFTYALHRLARYI